MNQSPDLTDREKWDLVCACLPYYDQNRQKVKYGQGEMLLFVTNRSRRTIQRVMREYFQKKNQFGFGNIDMAPKKKNKVGRKKQLTPIVRRRIIRENNKSKKTASIRKLSEAVNIPPSTLHRYVHDLGGTYTHSWLKPLLTDEHKLKRIEFIINLRRGRQWEFKKQFDTIVIDESWIYLYQDREKIRLFPGEERPPAVAVQHKSHIPKLMFLTAIARPREEHGFDGKVSIYRVSQRKVAQRNSRNHQRGEVYQADCTINSEIYLDLMKKVIDDVKVKMQWLRNTTIKLQQDGASPHTAGGVIDELEQYGSVDGWKFKIVTQPAQSPDLNINDLSFFRSFKTRVNQIKKNDNTLDGLYLSVLDAWNNYDSDTLNRMWGLQYACYRAILAQLGGNDYTPPHTGVRNNPQQIDLSIIREDYQAACFHLFN